jgi:hypothetical protein
MSDDICGYPTADGSPCQHPASDGDSCWLPSHGGDAESNGGRPRILDDEQTRQRVLVAVGQGLKVEHQASLAGISPDTLRRGLCCVDTPRDPTLESDPCEFCEDYAQSHANGAREVLQDCRPEFIASASYGYVKEEKRDVKHSGEGENGGIVIDLGSDE